MIDTTKTATQKKKEAAAARRTEKAQQKQAAKIAAKSVPVTIQASNDNSETLGSAQRDTAQADTIVIPAAVSSSQRGDATDPNYNE